MTQLRLDCPFALKAGVAPIQLNSQSIAERIAAMAEQHFILATAGHGGRVIGKSGCRGSAIRYRVAE